MSAMIFIWLYQCLFVIVLKLLWMENRFSLFFFFIYNYSKLLKDNNILSFPLLLPKDKAITFPTFVSNQKAGHHLWFHKSLPKTKEHWDLANLNNQAHWILIIIWSKATKSIVNIKIIIHFKTFYQLVINT